MNVTHTMIPEEYWTIASGDVRAFRDNWWMYVEGKGIVVARVGKRRDVFPQCNTDYRISELLLDKGYGPEGCIIKQVPLVLMPMQHDGALYIPKAWRCNG